MSDSSSCEQPLVVGWSSSLSELAFAFFYDCFILLRTLFDVFKIIICLIYHVIVFFYTLVSVFVHNCVYFISWVSVYFIRGILGLEDKSTSAFCWLLAIAFVYFYCEHQHHIIFTSLPRGLRFHVQQQNTFLRRLQRWSVFRYTSLRQPVAQQELSTAVVRENQRNAEAEIEPMNRQLEAQNVLNENEENFLVEADHRRVLHDNRHNVALENGADSQRALIENRQNVERECHNTQTSLENQRNFTQERHRYFLRQRRSLPALVNPEVQDRWQPELSDRGRSQLRNYQNGSQHLGLQPWQVFPNREEGSITNQS